MGWLFPASATLGAGIVPEGLRQWYYGVNFTLLNVGIGVGGVVGGLFVDVARVWTFQTIYLADALTFVVPVMLLLGPLRHTGRSAASAIDSPDATTVSYRRVLSTRGLPTLLSICFGTAFVGYAQLNAGMPAFATTAAHVSTSALGFAFAANTAVIIVLQLPVLRWIQGRRRTRLPQPWD